MNNAHLVVEDFERAGGSLEICGTRLRCRVPNFGAHLIEGLRPWKDEILLLLQQRDLVRRMPIGVVPRRRDPILSPILLTRSTVVIDVSKFVRTTLVQLDSALSGRVGLAGHWSPNELVDRLERCGVVVELPKIHTPDAPRGFKR